MKFLADHEKKMHGTFDFPIELYTVTPAHSRYEMPFHWHMESELIMVLSGKFSLSLESESFCLQAGEFAFIPSGIIHGGVPQMCNYKCLVFNLEHFLQQNALCRKKFENLLGHGESINSFFDSLSPVNKVVTELFDAIEKKQNGYELITTGLLLQFLGTAMQFKLYTSYTPLIKSNKREEQMKRVLRRIRKDYAQPLTLNELAKEASMAPKYFCRVFYQITEHTPINYLNYYRIECAAELLMLTKKSITEIAFECGFNDSGYFSRLFRRFKGVAPNEYRKSLKTLSK